MIHRLKSLQTGSALRSLLFFGFVLLHAQSNAQNGLKRLELQSGGGLFFREELTPQLSNTYLKASYNVTKRFHVHLQYEVNLHSSMDRRFATTSPVSQQHEPELGMTAQMDAYLRSLPPWELISAAEFGSGHYRLYMAGLGIYFIKTRRFRMNFNASYLISDYRETYGSADWVEMQNDRVIDYGWSYKVGDDIGDGLQLNSESSFFINDYAFISGSVSWTGIRHDINWSHAVGPTVFLNARIGLGVRF